MALTDAEIRHDIISLLTAETARDQQRRVGASNLSNGCAFCLAHNLVGDMRETPMLDRAWGGRVLGTAIHGILEDRAANNATFNARYPAAVLERKIPIGTLGTYGEVNSTPDLVLPSEAHLVDYKGTTKKKAAITQDAMAILRGQEPTYGRTHKDVKLSEREYAKEIAKAQYKIMGYYNQLLMYALGLIRNGTPIERMSIVFVSRDDTMWFDNPTLEGYEDPTRMHGVWVLSFNFNEAHALAAWDRALQIWNKLEAGVKPEEFPRHELCFPCSLDNRDQIAAAA